MALTLCETCQTPLLAGTQACPRCGVSISRGTATPSGTSTFRKPSVLLSPRLGTTVPNPPSVTSGQHVHEDTVRRRLLWGGAAIAGLSVLLILARTITMWMLLAPLGLLCLGALAVGLLRALQNQGLPSLPKTRRVHSLLLAVAAPLVFILAVAIVPKTAREQRQYDEFQRLEAQREADKEHRLQAQVGCEVYIRERLKAPSSADFSSSVAIAPREEGGYVVRGSVDAQNAFGAKLRRIYVCAVDAAGGVVTGSLLE
jgi:hypothetical protein